MDFFKETELEIINMKEPVIDILYYMFLEKIDTDETLSLKLRFIFKHHYKVAHDNDLQTYFNLLEMYPLTKNVINDYYNCIRKQYFLLPLIKNWYDMYINVRFWKQSLDKQINSLIQLRINFLSLFDASYGTIYFHSKIKGACENQYHIDEMIERLSKVYSMFKYKFYTYNKIIILTVDDFINCSFKKQIEYTEYIFSKIYKLLNQYIQCFQLYELYRVQLYTLTHPTVPINIEICDICSDVEQDDILFILDSMNR
jgi:hypothetical protein